MTDDLVSRLLAAIQEREKEHCETAEALDLAVAYGATVGSTEYIRTTTSEGLRLCQAHRQIVMAYEGAALQQRKRVDDKVNNGYVLGISRAVAELAGGYGIQERD